MRARNIKPSARDGEPKLYGRWAKIRYAVLERDQYQCQYCGSTEKPLHIDHVVPWTRGGGDELENLVAACAHCNLCKHNKTPEEWLGSDG